MVYQSLPTIEIELAACLKDIKRERYHGAVLNIAIENLTMILSSQGHNATQTLLNSLVDHLQTHLHEDDVIWRNDQDHIIICLTNYHPDEIESAVKNFSSVLRDYGCLNMIEPMQLVCRIGAVRIPDITTDAADALNHAYVALKDAQARMVHYMFYANVKRHHIESRNQLVLANYIQNAFLNQRLRLVYQPIVETKTGTVHSHECLLRILNADGSLSSAGPFIPIAEQMGFIDVIDSFVLQLVVKELQMDPTARLSVNVSNLTMLEADWLNFASKLLHDPDVASRLTVELIETSRQHEMQQAIRFIRTMKDLGCKVALDDFGTGYTSFMQLKHLPVDSIKIDGSFIRALPHSKDDQFFVQTLLGFAENFNLTSIAEYVENKDLADRLGEMKVDFMQGNYFSPAQEVRQ